MNTQLRQLNKSTELVTITAGGNNLKFGDIVTKCGAAIADFNFVPKPALTPRPRSPADNSLAKWVR